MTSATYAPQRSAVPHRAIVTVCAMIATLMQALDNTIANVALPYMMGSLSATLDQITWVLTSYIVAAAIFTAPVGWLAARFGRKNLFLACLAGFTIASMLCGSAESLAQMVVYRFLQGTFGAALVPLSQATMLDLYPIEQRGSAMAIWGMGVMLDRGEHNDWFGSTEIIIEAVLAGLGIYLFVVHLFTAEKPFITPRIFRDLNFVDGLLVMFSVGTVPLSNSA